MKTKGGRARLRGALGLCTVWAVAVQGSMLTFSKDTVYEEGFFAEESRDYVEISNSGVRSATIDTMLVLVDSDRIQEFQVQFDLRDPQETYWFGAQAGWPAGAVETNYGDNADKITVPAGGVRTLEGFEIDLCIACPLSKRTAGMIGDTMQAHIVFVRGAFPFCGPYSSIFESWVGTVARRYRSSHRPAL